MRKGWGLAVFSLEKRRLCGVLPMSVNTWEEAAKRTFRERLIKLMALTESTWALGTNWNTGISLWTSGNPFIIVWVTEHWHKLPREFLESPSLESLKSHLGMVLGNEFYLALLEWGHWTRRPQKVPSHVCHSVILWLSWSLWTTTCFLHTNMES